MTYAAAAHLQAAIFQRLTGHPALAGVQILDAQPASPLAESFILIGPEDVTDASDKTGAGAEHRVMISVISAADGFLGAKSIAAGISQAIEGAPLTLAQGRVLSAQFRRAVARRLDGGSARRIDLTYRIRIEF